MKLAHIIIPITAALFSACSTPEQGHEETFEQLWDEFDATYGSFRIRNIDWDDSYNRYRPRVTDEMSEDEFFAIVTNMLAETDDGHIHLIVPDRPNWSANRVYREKIDIDLFDIDLVRQRYLGGKFETNDYDWYTLGDLPSGATYLHLAGIDESTTIMSAARDRAEKSGRLVFDLRHNGGGDMTWAFSELAKWTSKDLVVSYNRTRNGPEREDFSDWYTSKVAGEGEDPSFEMVVLIDRFTISAGERLVLGLAQMEGVTFIGTPTNGSVATTVPKEMLNGWFYMAPTQEIMNPDRETTIEGLGYMPDIYLENDLTQMQVGVDAVLNEALAQLG